MMSNLPPVPAPPPPHPALGPPAPRLATDPTAAETVVSAIIAAQVATNDAKPPPDVSCMTAFHALEPPSIHVRDYVHRLASYSFCSTSCLLAAVHYVKRAVDKDPRLSLSSLNCHRLVVTALVLSAKYLDDVTYSMSYYAKVGGLPVKELVYLEIKLLQLLDFRLHIRAFDFHSLEYDLVETLVFVPRAPIVEDAKKLVKCANITSRPDYYCETLHPDDSVGYWLPHPYPQRHMLTCMELLSSPCQTPPRSLSPSLCSDAESSNAAINVNNAYPVISNVSLYKRMPPAGMQGSGQFSRFSSNCSVVTAVDVFDGSNSRNVAAMDDRQSGPLMRHISNTSTITSEGSSGCSDMSGNSVYSDGETVSWTGAAVGRAYCGKNVYCRLGGNMSGDQCAATTGEQGRVDASARKAQRDIRAPYYT